MFASYRGQARPTSPVTSRRKVFANAMVAHVWAQQTHEEGRSGNGNFYFYGRTIYSYGRHFRVATFTDATGPNGHRVVLVNNESRSVSTSGHQRYVNSALRGLPVHVFEVPCVPDGIHESAMNAAHLGNVDYFTNAFQSRADRLAKPHVRDWRTDRDSDTWGDLDASRIVTARCDALSDSLRTLQNYCATFALECPAIDLQAAQQKIRDAFARYLDPKRVAKREAARLKNGGDMRHYRAMARAHAFLEGVIDARPNLNFVPYRIERGLKRTIANEIYNRERAARLAANPNARPVTEDEWLAGLGDAFQGFERTLVRRKGDTLQTSRGAECPFSHAVVAFLKAQHCRATRTEWHRNGQQIRVGHFNVDAIDSDGSMRAGCHTLLYADMLALAIREIPQQVRACFPLPAIV